MGNDYSGLTGKSSGDFGSGLPYISYLNVFRNDIVTDGPFDCVKVSKMRNRILLTMETYCLHCLQKPLVRLV